MFYFVVSVKRFWAYYNRKLNKNQTILLVDDDADVRDIFCETLKQIDNTLRCSTAFDGLEALNVLNANLHHPPDLIFLDLNMPRLNGKQFLLQLKAHPVWHSIPVVIYSTSRLIKDVQELKEIGALDFLSKPTRVKDLRKSLGKIIKLLL